MRSIMLEMMKATSSPLLTGHVPPPEKQLSASARYRYKGEHFQKFVEKRRIGT
jgi:hypothetical protein